MASYCRYFTHINEITEAECGRYRGDCPSQAAKKCASRQFRRMKVLGQNTNEEIIVLIREVSRCSKKKTFSYKAKLINLPTPHQVHMIGGHSIIYKHIIHITKTPIPSNFIKNSTKQKLIESIDSIDSPEKNNIVNLLPTNLLTIEHNFIIEV